MATTKTRSTSSKKTAKKVAAKKAQPVVAKKVIRKKPKQFSVWFGPNERIQITIKRARKAKNKKQQVRLPRLSAALVVIGMLGTIFFSKDVFRPTPSLAVYSPPIPVAQQNPTPQLKIQTLTKSVPVSLSIPTINLSTSLTSVGQQSDNTLEVPVTTEIPGWYRYSPTPGELGPSVIVGHVDSVSGPAIFWRLRELTVGHIIEVKRTDNTTAKFKVTEVLQFEQNAFPTNKVYGDIDHAGLRLITCGGSFNRFTGQYSHNTIVFASLEL